VSLRPACDAKHPLPDEDPSLWLYRAGKGWVDQDGVLVNQVILGPGSGPAGWPELTARRLHFRQIGRL
jgi:hypothetical protein